MKPANPLVYKIALINIQPFTIGLAFICFLMLLSSCSSKVQQPNIILIMTDDQGWYDAGFNGNQELQTPHLDFLASNGIVLDRFYSASAVCSPTRASVITGRNPLRVDIPFANQGHMKDEEITLPEILNTHGYATGHFGKWHLGTLSQKTRDSNRGGKEEFLDEYTIPSDHGYETFFCTEAKVPTYDPLIFPEIFEDGESKHYGWKAVENDEATSIYGTAYWKAEGVKETSNLEGDNSRVIMDRVIPFIENSLKGKRPFFTTIWFHTPHLPVVSDSVHQKMYAEMGLAEQLYYGTITAMDEQVGRLWDKLEEHGEDENTIIFFCSDNGPENGTPGSTGVFRARKRSLYEGGVRVPAFVIWKNHFAKNKRIDFPMVTSDYLPTVIDILDIKYPGNMPLDGISVLGAIEGKKNQRTEPIGFIIRNKISWVTQQYKLIGDVNGDNFELYDLINDKAEANNIIDQNLEIAEKLKKELAAWQQSVERSQKGMDYE